MKVLLTALNSKFIHSNLAVRYLKSYTKDMDYNCVIREFTINDRMEKILEEIIKEKADVLVFSCYIWNIEFIQRLAKLIKLIKPNIDILYGGPEVSYDSEGFLKGNVGNYVICGEGEETYRDFIKWEIEYRSFNSKDLKEKHLEKLNSIRGLCFKRDGEVSFNGERPLMNMENIVFPYEEDDDLKNKIVYFESSRGCPFMCKYCLSSTTHGVRFLNIERVKKELLFLINKGVKLIKFVDRTFNCNPQFAMDVWKFLIELDTEATFHFEISADILTDEQLKLLSKASKGRFQFEVGVQTTNNEILENINRHVNFEDIKEKVVEMEKIKNIMQHLDLIAGLPGEDFKSFKKSFNDVYSIAPEEIQLGFLKLLKGSSMRKEADEWGMLYSPYPPYEILKTKDISYEDLRILKRVEEVVDKYYNSRKFGNILSYFLSEFQSAFDFYYSLGMFFYNKGYLSRSISSADYYKVFIEFNEEILKQDSVILKEIIKYDYLKFNKKKWLPSFLNRYVNKDTDRLFKNAKNKNIINIPYENYHVENFKIDVLKFSKDQIKVEGNFYLIFDEDNIENIQDITKLIDKI